MFDPPYATEVLEAAVRKCVSTGGEITHTLHDTISSPILSGNPVDGPVFANSFTHIQARMPNKTEAGGIWEIDATVLAINSNGSLSAIVSLCCSITGTCLTNVFHIAAQGEIRRIGLPEMVYS